eukprot:tig00020616_g12287.t2
MSDAEEAPRDVIAQFIDQVKDLRRWVVEQASRPNRQRQPWPVLELARAGWLDTHYNSGGALYVRSHDEGRIIDEFKRIWFALGSKLSILSTLPDHIRMQILEWYAKARDSQWDDVNLRDLSRLRSAVTARDIREWEEWSNDPKNWLPGEAEMRKRARLMPGDSAGGEAHVLRGGSPAENFMERVLYLVRWIRDEFHDERELPDREMIRAAGLMGMTENPRSYLRRERRDLNGDWADLQALWTAFANRKSQILALPAQVQQRIIDFVAPWRDESLQQPFMQPRFLSGLRSAFFHLAVSSDRYFTPQRIVHGEFGIPPSG